MNIKRGEVYYTELPDRGRGIQRGLRPVVVVSNDVGNYHSDIAIIAPITSQKKTQLPTHVDVALSKKSIILCEQLTIVHKSKLFNNIYTLSKNELNTLDTALMVSLGIVKGETNE